MWQIVTCDVCEQVMLLKSYNTIDLIKHLEKFHVKISAC